MHHHGATWPDYSFKRVFHWFLLANRNGRYSATAVTSLQEDAQTILKAGSLVEALENLSKRLRVPQMEEKEFLGRHDRPDSRFALLMLYLLLFSRWARDWIDNTGLGYDQTGDPLIAAFESLLHPIYPRSTLRKHGYEDYQVNVLANITMLNEKVHLGNSP